MSKCFPKGAHEMLEFTDRDGVTIWDVLWRGKVIGSRTREPDGSLIEEYQVDSRGRQHGFYRNWTCGRLTFETGFRLGREHGTARQWGLDGRLLGTYRMHEGTGVDLWRDEVGRLSEEHNWKDRMLHGFDRWWNGDDQTVHRETHWHNGLLHGIEREWDDKGTLEKGYPRFYVKGKRVTRAVYIAARTRSRTLPRFDEADNTPQRRLPREYARQLTSRALGSRPVT